MPYDNHGISIYAHPNNNLQRENPKKQFYYSPMSQLLHKSAEASFNNVIKQHEVTFRIQMWSEEFEDQVRKYTEQLVKHPIEPEKIRVLPVEMVKLSSEHKSPSYQLKDQWIHYKRDKVLSFKLTSQKFDTCQQLAGEMRSSPQQFNHLFRLEFTTSTRTLKSQEIAIKMGTIADGSLILELIQRYPEERDIFLTAEDELLLLNEAKTNIIASLGESFHLDPTSEEKIDDLLKNLLIESPGQKTSNHSPDIWESVFWREENYRPDKIAKLMNKMFRKLNIVFQEEWLICFNEDSKVPCNLSVQLLDALSKHDSLSKEQLDKLIKESKGNVIWNGKEFIPKPISVSKLNRVKLSEMKSLPDKKTIISDSRVMFSTGVTIQANYKEEDLNQISQLKSKLEDLQAKINTSIPKEIQDFKSACQLLRGKVNEMETAVTSNAKQLKEQKPVSDSTATQVRQLDEQGKETLSELSKLKSNLQDVQAKINTTIPKEIQDFKSAFDLLRGKVNELDASVTSNVKQLKELKPISDSMVHQVRQLMGDQGKDWNEGKNGGFVWQDNCDFWNKNVKDIVVVDSAKEDCGIKCLEKNGCTHFTWNGKCILKKAPASENFVHLNNAICGKLKASETSSELSKLKSDLQDLQAKINTAIPKEIQDFKSAFDLLRGKVNELDASVTLNVKLLKELKPVSDSMVTQVRQLDQQGKETSSEFSKLRSEVSDWNEGKGGSFLWKENCDFWGSSHPENVRDIITVDSAKEDCGIKCQEHSECTHFTWNGGCILKKAPVSENFRHNSFAICGKLKKVTVLAVIPTLDSMLTQIRQLGEQGKVK